ncbi:MAG: DNA polymerase III, delta prime subunit [Clostridia bacterium 41_269]|nr:MAG: DNA polymerase III, delta prime subunit [Clostridia bacterium 41_269]
MLKQIRSQNRAVFFLEKILKSRELGHCYLFCGPQGVGKMSTAVLFAASVLCQTPRGLWACGSCATCRKIERGNYPYLRIVEPQGSTLGIGQVRQLKSFLTFKIEGNHFRFIIIDKAHNMTQEASNSLLKVLEEPPQRTCFILVADNIDMVLPTIVSRSQIIPFTRIPQGVVEEILREKGYSEEKIAAAASIAHGSVGRALELVEDEKLEAQRKMIVDFMESLPVSPGRVLEFALDLGSNFDVALTLEIILSSYRSLLLKKITENGKQKEDESLFLDVETLCIIIDRVIKAKKDLDDNANKQLVLDTLLMDINEQVRILKEGNYATGSWS